MAPPKKSISGAYITLGIDEDSSLDEVKSAYKKLALSTHPDKNPGNADATAQFQEISEAYNILVKHLDRSTRPPRNASSHGPPRGFSYSDEGFDYDGFDYDSEDYYDEDEDEYDDEEDMGFYMWMFEEMLRGRGASRFAQSQYHHFHRPEPETPEQYQERLRRSREIQIAGEERRAKEDAERKLRVEKEREKERQEAEVRQKAKKAKKKGQAEASRKNAENAVRTQQQRAQDLRSATFAAARAGNTSKVKKGVYEDNVDAAGGEAKKGCEDIIAVSPNDPKETLMHIAVKHGDVELANWLEAHSVDLDERDSAGLTAFHVALQLGRIDILKTPFFDNYPPSESENSGIYAPPESTSLLLLAIDSCEPEAVWMILDKGLASTQDIGKAWALVSTAEWKQSTMKVAFSANAEINEVKLDEIRQLMMAFGGFTPPPTPKVDNQHSGQQAGQKKNKASFQSNSTSDAQQTNANGSGRGKGRGRGRGRGRGK